MKREAHERAAQKAARQTRVDYDLREYPLNVDALASAMGLNVDAGSQFPANTYGALFRFDNDFRILISTECHGDGQRRFTVGHEIGHYVLEGHVEELFDGGANVHMSDTDNFRGRKLWYEVEADAFAAELLVPSDLARDALGQRSGLDAVRCIETTFGTSLSCAAVRFAAVTPQPAAIILSHGKAIEWVAWSHLMARHQWTRASFKGEWAPPRSATLCLSKSAERVRDAESMSGAGLLSEWFDSAPAVEVSEEAVGLGRYGRVLTVLTCERLPSPDAEHVSPDRIAESDRGRSWRDAVRPWSWDSYESPDED